MHIELFLTKKPIHKSLWLCLAESVVNKITDGHGGTEVARTRRVCVKVIRIKGFASPATLKDY